VNDNQKFGKYEIVRKLGGGMANVYLARNDDCDQCVVVKTIENAGENSRRLAMEAEKRGAEIQRQLSKHDRILDVYEAGEQNGCFFVVMEYFPGRTLANILATEGRLDAKRATRYAAEICNQLRILHGFGSEDGATTAVVHGDIKPSNIQVGADDQLRILDFGIAKFISAGREMTRHELGSPSYCSPERIRDSQVDVYADLWAVAITLYEMLAGAPPFEAQDTRKLERLIQSSKPSTSLPADCPAELRAIVAKSLNRDIRKRYESAEAFENDLLAFLEDRETQAARERAERPTLRATLFRRTRAIQIPAVQAASVGGEDASYETQNIAIALLAGLLSGLILFLPVTYYFRMREISRDLIQRKDYVLLPAWALAADWDRYRTFKQRDAWWRELFQMDKLERGFETNLIGSANNLIGRFRRSSDGRLGNFDWARARLCLLYALQIDPLSPRARGQLYLCDGYLAMEGARPGVDAFRRAETLLPRSPDPHLGLARAYLFFVRNVGLGLAEFHQAEQLGYKLGPREIEQEADGYLLRAEAELNRARRTPVSTIHDATKWLRLAQGDLGRAQNLYEPIAGFGHVETRLAQLYADQTEQGKLESAVLMQPPARPPLILLKARFVRRTGWYRWR
jgi:eukaryotic-like serine/threonine-protein kinase